MRYFPKFCRGFLGRLLVATMAASMLAGCGGGSHSVLPDAGPNVSIAAHDSVPTQPLSSSVNSKGGITEYSLPFVRSSEARYPARIAAGSDGNVWFTDLGTIGRITTHGKVTEYSLIPTKGASEITAGRDGNLWFTTDLGSIGKFDMHSKITDYPIPTAPLLSGIAAGPDGSLWFTEKIYGKIGKITTSGKITEYPVSSRYGVQPLEIAAGPDGNLWFTETEIGTPCGEFPCPILAYKIGKITIAGKVAEYPLPLTGGGASGIAAGPDGNLWFTENTDDKIGKIGKITTSGKITEYPIPTAFAAPLGIIAGPDRNLWFTEYGSDKIGKIDPARP